MRASWAEAALVLMMSGGWIAAAEEHGFPSRYMVFSIDPSGVLRPEFHAVVRLAGERRTSRSEEELSAWLGEGSAEREHVAVRLLDASGRVVFREAVSVPRWLHSEAALHGETAQRLPAEDAPVPMPGRAFVVRVPFVEGSRLRMSRGAAMKAGLVAAPADQEFSADAIAEDQSLPLAAFKPDVRPLTVPAPTSGNRVDLLVMGDGYTAAQTAKFTSDTAAILASFLAISPYSVYSNYFNITPLFTASNQSGADHPPYASSCPVTYPPTCCSDPLMQSDPLQGTFVDTAFDGAYCSTNTHRQVTVSQPKVLAAAAASPDWDEILMVVNDTTYGGSGGAFSVVSTNFNAVDVARHEFGHTFSRLADEYTSPYPGFPACSDLGGPDACEANVTDQTRRGLLKWAAWVLPTTPIPTPDTSAFASVVGLFDGARYKSTGFYRPQRSCLMNTLGVPFCAICSEQFVLRLYRGGWGVPVGGIDTIEPGSENPAPGVVSLPFPSSRTFSVSLLQPAGGPPLALSWAIDGVTVPGASGPSYTFTPPAPGRYQLQLTARDATPLVLPAMAGSAMVRTRAWTVDAGTIGDLSIGLSDNGSAKEGQPLVYTLVSRNSGPDSAIGATVADALPPQIIAPTWTCSASAGSACPASGAGNVNAVVDLIAGGSATFVVTGTVAAGTSRQIVSSASIMPPSTLVEINPADNSATVTTPVARKLSFHTVPPCRLVDTRGAEAPALAAAAARTFTVAGRCQIPPSAWAVSMNLTVTQPTGPGNLRAFPAGTPLPFASSLNYAAGQTRGNNVIPSLNAAGEVSVFCGQSAGTTHFLMDVNGYFE